MAMMRHDDLSDLGALACGVSDEELAQIVAAARAEALIEVRARLKEMMIAAMLARATGMLDELCQPADAIAPMPPASAPTMEAAPTSAPRAEVAPARAPTPEAAPASVSSGEADAEALRQEVEAIRRQIAQNEGKLSQMRGAPAVASAAQPTPVESAGDAGCGYYVYGVVGAGERMVWPASGMDPEYGVYTITHGPLQAVVSQVRLSEFGQEELEGRLQDLAWVEEKARLHQEVLNTVLASCTLIPMRFCTIYRSEAGVQAILASRLEEFTTALESLRGRQEWSVRVYRDDAAVTRKVAETSERVREGRAKLAGKSDGAAYFLKKKVEDLAQEEAERFVDSVAQECHDRLSAAAAGSHLGPLQSRSVTKRTDDMTVNGSYLIATAERARFDAALEDLQTRFGPAGFTFEMVGPWPPYHFVTIGSMEESAHDGADS